MFKWFKIKNTTCEDDEMVFMAGTVVDESGNEQSPDVAANEFLQTIKEESSLNGVVGQYVMSEIPASEVAQDEVEHAIEGIIRNTVSLTHQIDHRIIALQEQRANVLQQAVEALAFVKQVDRSEIDQTQLVHVHD